MQTTLGNGMRDAELVDDEKVGFNEAHRYTVLCYLLSDGVLNQNILFHEVDPIHNSPSLSGVTAKNFCRHLFRK